MNYRVEVKSFFKVPKHLREGLTNCLKTMIVNETDAKDSFKVGDETYDVNVFQSDEGHFVTKKDARYKSKTKQVWVWSTDWYASVNNTLKNDDGTFELGDDVFPFIPNVIKVRKKKV